MGSNPVGATTLDFEGANCPIRLKAGDNREFVKPLSSNFNPSGKISLWSFSLNSIGAFNLRKFNSSN